MTDRDRLLPKGQLVAVAVVEAGPAGFLLRNPHLVRKSAKAAFFLTAAILPCGESLIGADVTVGFLKLAASH
jgi:hypothetical protein